MHVRQIFQFRSRPCYRFKTIFWTENKEWKRQWRLESVLWDHFWPPRGVCTSLNTKLYVMLLTTLLTQVALENVINKLGKNTNHLFQWFRNNESKENTKYHLLVTGDCDKAQTWGVKSSNIEKFLGIKIETKFYCKSYFLTYQNSNPRSTLPRITNYADLKNTGLMNAFITSHFN